MMPGVDRRRRRSTSCRSAATTTAAASRSRTIPGPRARGKRRRPDRSRPATSPPWAFRSVRGRLFEPRDARTAPRVVSSARRWPARYWPGEDPVGRRITFNSGIPRDQQQVVGGPGSREVVGIVGDVRHLGLDEAPVPMFYTPHAQQPSYHTMTLVVRTAGDVTGLAAAMRAALREMDAGGAALPGAARRSGAVACGRQPRLRALLIGALRALASLLAALGVYGVVSYVVQQRTHEIGVRMSLGATGRDVLRWCSSMACGPCSSAWRSGCSARGALSRTIGALLFGVTPGDAPATRPPPPGSRSRCWPPR